MYVFSFFAAALGDGGNNVYIGSGVKPVAGTGAYNTAVGWQALALGADNRVTAIGAAAGTDVAPRYQSTLIGYNAGSGANSANALVCIGAGCAGSSTAGRLCFGSAMDSVKASATAGTNGAPPAQVTAYMPINYNGVAYRIPLYNA